MQPHGSATISFFDELIRGMEAGEAVWLMGDGGRTARLAGVQGESELLTTSIAWKWSPFQRAPCNPSVRSDKTLRSLGTQPWGPEDQWLDLHAHCQINNTHPARSTRCRHARRLIVHAHYA